MMKVIKTDGSIDAYDISKVDRVVFDITKSAPAHAVDLGLSVKWADMNVGAESPEDYGGYFA